MPENKNNLEPETRPEQEPKEASHESRWQWAKPSQWIIAGALGAFSLLADQISKLLVAANLFPGQRVIVIDPVLWILYARNYDAVFSINVGPRFILILMPLIAVGFVTYLLLRPQNRFTTVLLGLILGGGLGNLVDRIRLGYVVDWISLWLPPLKIRWATFNISDASVVVPVILLLIYELFFTWKKKEPAGEQETE